MEPQNPANDDQQPSKWCDLPKDLLIKISQKLVFSSKIHLTRIRSVCSQWRSSLSLDQVCSLDFRVPVPPLDPRIPLALVDTCFYLLSPQPGCDIDGRWIVRMCPTEFNKWHIFNPLNIHDYFFTNPPVVGSINLLDSNVLQLSRPFSLLDANETKAKPISKKVVGGWNLGSNCHFGVLALFESEHGGGLWLWRLNDKEWFEIEGTSCTHDHICAHQIIDIAYHDGKFYAFELSTWRIGVIDPNSHSGSVTMDFFDGPAHMFDGYNDENKYLLKFNGRSYLVGDVSFVSSNGSLYLVVEAAFPECRPKCVDLADVISGQVDLDSFFDDDDEEEEEEKQTGPKSTLFVFVMKEKTEVKQGVSGVWEQVNNIGDHIFFIGYDTSFVVSSASVNLPQWKPGSICLFTRTSPLFSDGFSFADSDDDEDRVPEGLKSMKSMSYATYWRYFRLFEMGEEEKGVLSFEKYPLDVYTGLFFPPPPWVQWRCPGLDNVDISFEGLKFSEW